MTLSINDNITTLCLYAESRVLFIVMLIVVVLSVIILSLIVLSVITLSFVVLSVIMLSLVVLSVIMLSLVVLSVIMLSLVLLSVIMLSFVVLSVIILSLIVLSVIMLSLVVLSVIMLKLVVLSVIMLSVVTMSVLMLWHHLRVLLKHTKAFLSSIYLRPLTHFVWPFKCSSLVYKVVFRVEKKKTLQLSNLLQKSERGGGDQGPMLKTFLPVIYKFS
jgi:hypothetical protein